MRIDIDRTKELINIKLVGEYDIQEVHFFNSLFIDELNKKPSNIALNLGELKYIDSSAIGSLIRCMNMAAKDDINFICYNLNEKIKEIFKLAKLERYFQILSDEEFKKRFIVNDSTVEHEEKNLKSVNL